MIPKKVKTLTADTDSHSKFQANMICSFVAILAWKSDDADDDADDDYDDDHKSDPYMSPSYAGDTKTEKSRPFKIFLKHFLPWKSRTYNTVIVTIPAIATL